MTVKEAIKDLLSKAKQVDMREFSKHFGDISNVLFKQGDEPSLRKEILKLLGISGRYDGIMSKDLWLYANGISMNVYDKGKITVEALSDKVLKRLGGLEKKIIEKLADFTQKVAGKKLHITIGEQPISVAGPGGFRITVPDTKEPISYMFPYHSKIIPAYQKLEDAGVPVQWIWAAHDWFHELAHSLGQNNEKKADTFAFRTAKKFFSSKYPKVKQVTLGAKNIGEIYHFASFINAANIFKTNYLVKGKTGYVSFTRNKNLHKKPVVGFKTDVRFTIDGDKLSENYKLKPYKYHGIDVDVVDESEERGFKKVNNVQKYIKQITVFRNRWPENADPSYNKFETIMGRFIDPVSFESFVQKAKDFKKTVVASVNKDIVDAIRSYTARGGSMSSKFPWNMSKRKILMDWISKQKNKKATFYRGLSFSEKEWDRIYEKWINEGFKHTIDGLESFSRDPNRVFGYGSGGDVYVKVALTGTSYADIEKYSIYPEEKEVIFKPGTKYVIKKSEFKRPTTLYVEAKEL